MFLALGIATVIYIAVALGVFGTLTVDKVIASGGTALAVAAEPTLGRAGYWMMTVTALFSTAGATNAGLYPAAGLSEQMASIGQFPPLLGRRFGRRASAGLLLTALVAIVLAAGFDLSSIASLGSTIALVVFALVTAGHLRVRRETGANVWVLGLALASTVIVLATFVVTTLVEEPATAVTLCVILAMSVALDFGWKRRRNGKSPSSPTHAAFQQVEETS
jgi:amino acid transporter